MAETLNAITYYFRSYFMQNKLICFIYFKSFQSERSPIDKLKRLALDRVDINKKS